MNCTNCNTPGAPCEMINGLCHACTAASLRDLTSRIKQCADIIDGKLGISGDERPPFTRFKESFLALLEAYIAYRHQNDQLKAQLEAARAACAEMRNILTIIQREKATNWEGYGVTSMTIEHALSSTCGNAYMPRAELQQTITILECALDYALGRIRVSFSGKQFGAEAIQAELSRLQALRETTP